MGYIYVIKNEITNMSYVGQTTKQPYQRWGEHLISIGKEDKPLYVDMKLCGWQNFSFRVIEEVEDEKLNEREYYWIRRLDSFKNGYNHTIPPTMLDRYKADQLQFENTSVRLVGKGLILCQLDRNTKEVIGKYRNATDAARDLFPELSQTEHNQKGKHISSASKGVKATAYGFCWEWRSREECE